MECCKTMHFETLILQLRKNMIWLTRLTIHTYQCRFIQSCRRCTFILDSCKLKNKVNRPHVVRRSESKCSVFRWTFSCRKNIVNLIWFNSIRLKNCLKPTWKMNYKYLICVDLKATCWPNNSNKENAEILGKFSFHSRIFKWFSETYSHGVVVLFFSFYIRICGRSLERKCQHHWGSFPQWIL